jgi:hypothetical protein
MAAVKKVLSKIQQIVQDNSVLKEYELGKQVASGGITNW